METASHTQRLPHAAAGRAASCGATAEPTVTPAPARTTGRPLRQAAGGRERRGSQVARNLGCVAAGVLAGALLLPAAAGASSSGGSGGTDTGGTAASATVAQNATTLSSPDLPGVAPLPGPVAAPAQPSSNMGLLSVEPSTVVAGTPITISGTGLTPDASYELTWSSAEATWVVDPEPDTVNYLGRSDKLLDVVLANVTTSAGGSFSLTTKAPQDFGGIHDLYAVRNGTEVAHGGLILKRTFSISPTSGPVGTPIRITYSGLGDTLYTGGASLLYDNHYAGELMANWTRGTATAVIRATGSPGKHLLQIGNAISYLYLNVPQSPIPYTNGGTATFTVTKDAGPPATSIDWPADVAPTLSARTTLQAAGLSTSSAVHASLSADRGAVRSRTTLRASGLTPNATVDLQWSTVVGNRVNCASTCWAFTSTDLDPGRASATGTFARRITVPDGLGGWHVVQVVENGKTVAELPYYVHVSVVGRGVSAVRLHEGQEFTIHLKGVGWTQLDNTLAVDYDNSYVGYACGFNSNGDVVLHLRATGGPGTHLIDLYPMLYTLSPSFPNTPYGMVPVLTYAEDEPGLALGYHLPALRFAVTIVR